MKASLHRASNAHSEQSAVTSYDPLMRAQALTAGSQLGLADGHCEEPSGDSLTSWCQNVRCAPQNQWKRMHLQSPHPQSEVLMLEWGFFFWKRSILLKVPDFKEGLRENLLCHFSLLCLLNTFQPLLCTFSFRLLLSGCTWRIWNQCLVHAAIYKRGKKTPRFKLRELMLLWASGQGLLYGEGVDWTKGLWPRSPDPFPNYIMLQAWGRWPRSATVGLRSKQRGLPGCVHTELEGVTDNTRVP